MNAAIPLAPGLSVAPMVLHTKARRYDQRKGWSFQTYPAHRIVLAWQPADHPATQAAAVMAALINPASIRFEATVAMHSEEVRK